jgi:hypothetical protein
MWLGAIRGVQDVLCDVDSAIAALFLKSQKKQK